MVICRHGIRCKASKKQSALVCATCSNFVFLQVTISKLTFPPSPTPNTSICLLPASSKCVVTEDVISIYRHGRRCDVSMGDISSQKKM